MQTYESDEHFAHSVPIVHEKALSLGGKHVVL